MGSIKEVTSGSLAKNNKLNEVIRAINALNGMTVREGASTESPKLVVGTAKVELITTAGGGGGASSGESIDVIWCINGVPTNGTVVGTIGDAV